MRAFVKYQSAVFPIKMTAEKRKKMEDMKMKTVIKTTIVMGMLTVFTACGGSGGGSGGTPIANPAGSATFNNLSQGSANNVCFSTSTIGTAASCSVNGTPSNQTSSATCSVGTASIVCNVGGRSYGLVTSGSASADQACVDAGGTVQVTCKITTSGACSSASGVWTPANNPSVGNSTDCANAGGVFYTTLQHLRGSMPIANLSAGNNIISADPTAVATALGLFNGVSDLDSTNLTLVSMTATAAIGSYWEYPFYMTSTSVYNFRSTAVEFSATSPISTSSGGAITIKTNSAFIYYQ